MLPFLKNQKKSVAGVIIQQRSPDAKPESEVQESTSPGQDLLDAIEAKDASKVEAAIKACAEAKDSKEDKPSPHTYEAQNQLAAKPE